MEEKGTIRTGWAVKIDKAYDRLKGFFQVLGQMSIYELKTNNTCLTKHPADTAAQTAIDEAFEQGRIAGLQEAILALMSKNGPITDQMRRDVDANVYHDSLINWIKSFR